MVLDREAGDAVVGIGNDFTAHRIDAHLQPVRGGFVTEALADLALGIGMQRQGQAERRACRLPGVVIRRGTDAAKAEDDVARGETLLKGLDEPRWLVTDIARPGKLQATCAKRFGELAAMLVLTAARQDFVADDDGSKGHGDLRENVQGRFCGVLPTTTQPLSARWRSSAASRSSPSTTC